MTDGGFLTMCLRFGTKADVTTTSNLHAPAIRYTRAAHPGGREPRQRIAGDAQRRVVSSRRFINNTSNAYRIFVYLSNVAEHFTQITSKSI